MVMETALAMTTAAPRLASVEWVKVSALHLQGLIPEGLPIGAVQGPGGVCEDLGQAVSWKTLS